MYRNIYKRIIYEIHLYLLNEYECYKLKCIYVCVLCNIVSINI